MYATLIGKDRRHAGKGLLAVGCYAFLLPIATAIAIAISGRSDDMGRLDFGSTPVLIVGFLVAGVRGSRAATGWALLLGAMASAIQALPLALRGRIIGDHASGLVVLAATIAVAVAVFFIARAAPSSEQEPKVIGKEYVPTS